MLSRTRPAFTCFTATVASVRQVSSLPQAVTELKGGQSFAVVVPNVFRPVSWLTTHMLPKDLDIRNIELEFPHASDRIRCDEDENTLVRLLPQSIRKRTIPSRIPRALIALACAHAQATGASRVLARIAVVHGTPCTRLHVDKVQLRTICSLFGPGCVIAPRDAVDVHTLLNSRAVRNPQLRPEEHDDLVLRHPEMLINVKPGEVSFLRGIGSEITDNLKMTACVHRSPRLNSIRRRLILQIDDYL